MIYVCLYFSFKAIEQDDENTDKHIEVIEASDVPDPQVCHSVVPFSVEGGSMGQVLTNEADFLMGPVVAHFHRANCLVLT